MFWKKKKDKILLAPAKGKLVAISEVPDAVFSQKMMGDGYALIPEDGNFVAPLDGLLENVFDTGHAFGITGDNGLEILVHIGIDTVELRGQGFRIVAEAGQQVKAGETIVEVDLEFIRKEGYNPITPVVILNQDHEFHLELQADRVLVRD